MKRFILLLTAASLVLTFAACGDEEIDETTQSISPETTEAEITKKPADIVLYADFSYGSQEAEKEGRIKTENVHIEDFTVKNVADALSEWTGLNFEVNSVSVEGNVYRVDWSKDSTLIKGIGDTPFKDDFFFYDTDTLNWFMMDTLFRTIRENFNAAEVYYTMDNGKELHVQYLSPADVFPVDIPYQGSPFYFSHANNLGDEEILDENLYGTWVIEDDLRGLMEPAEIRIGDGNKFTTFLSDGTPGTEGYITYNPEKELYKMFDNNDIFFDGFYIRNENTIGMSEGAAAEYTKQ